MSTFTNCKVAGKSVDPAKYHSANANIARGHPDFVMSRSELMTFLACPSKWFAGFVFKDTSATEWGTLIDGLVLDRQFFGERFVVTPETYYSEKERTDKPWTAKATVCKEWEEEQETAGKIIIKYKSMCDAEKAIARLREDLVIADLIDNSDKQVMATGEYHDKATGLVIKFQTLIDLVPLVAHAKFGRYMGDFKTARNAHPAKWQKVVQDSGYHVQAALNLDLYVGATGEDRNTFVHIISENVAPYQSSREMISEDFVRLGRMTYQAALALYCQCLKRKEWPDYIAMAQRVVDGFALCEPDPFKFNQALDLPRLSEAAVEATDAAPEQEDVPT